MGQTHADLVICGAGIAGVSAAFHLSRLQPGLRIVLVDERTPLSLTSDKSTECYRNWWPEPAMIRLLDRSIQWLERWAGETGNAFGLSRRGYLYASMSEQGGRALHERARTISGLGAGALRVTSIADILPVETELASGGQRSGPGAVFCANPDAIRSEFPYLSPETQAVLHVRRAGWFRAHELGTWLLQQAEAAGVTRLMGRLTDVDAAGGAIRGVTIETAGGAIQVASPILVDAAGPFAGAIGDLAGVPLPLSWELHLKAAFRDDQHVVPREAPLVILTDEQQLLWSEDEKALLNQSAADRALLDYLPGGAHLRPEGPADSPYCLLLWPYRLPPVTPVFPFVPDPAYAEIAMRGMSRLIPGLRTYVARMPKSDVDGGYYTRTVDNLPLIGPTPVEGFFLIAALSGFGVMASPAAGEILALEILGQDRPVFADAYLLRRFESATYLEQLTHKGDTGEL